MFELFAKYKKLIIVSAIIFLLFSVIFPIYYRFYIKKIFNFKIVPIKVTIPEGFTRYDIADRLRPFKNFNKENFLKITQNLEGYLFPDTYFFTGNENESDIKNILQDNFKKKAEEAKKEIIIMASILEKEVQKEEDKKIVAGILWKRLRENMPLQVDATLYYITGKTSAELTATDLKINSPYNTYLYKGSPAGAISNPGIESINAALEPTESPYWYYLSDKNGKIHYAKTFEEHKANKQKYLR